MLVRFAVENFLSFRDRVEFSMVAGKTKEHLEHIVETGNDIDSRLLKTGVIYGANAAGKSNLVKALLFAQEFIVSRPKSDERIRVTPFLLDRSSLTTASKFEFEIECECCTYIYEFEVDREEVHSEYLATVSGQEETTVYTRGIDDFGNRKLTLCSVHGANERDRKILDSTRDTLRPNELFLSKVVDNNIAYLKDLYNWFRDTLRIVLPDTLSLFVANSLITSEVFQHKLHEIVDLFDVGIEGLESRNFDTDPSTDSMAEFLRRIGDNLREVALRVPGTGVFLFMDADKQVSYTRLVTIRDVKDAESKVEFGISQESDGTQRLIDLSMPLMSLLSGNYDQVLVIDELDLRLHPHMTKNILDIFLTNSIGKRSQFIATTHEAGLLDLDLLRKDEIWFIEKDSDGNSTVYSLEEFVPQYDRDIQASYLQGRFGAIPIVPSYNVLEWAK